MVFGFASKSLLQLLNKLFIIIIIKEFREFVFQTTGYRIDKSGEDTYKVSVQCSNRSNLFSPSQCAVCSVLIVLIYSHLVSVQCSNSINLFSPTYTLQKFLFFIRQFCSC